MSGDLLDDDYVAKLLAEDAKKSSRHAAHDLTTSVRRDGLKPNTRFLRHIVREADGHNAALKRKEEREASRRLRALQTDHEPRKRRRVDETDLSKRKRLLNDIVGAASDHRSSKQPRGSNHSKDHDSRRHTGSRDKEPASTLRRSRRSASPDRKSHRHRRRSTSREAQNGGRVFDDRETKPRGRALHHKPSSDRFAEDYDPSQDVAGRSDLEDDEDWEMALEAMRDRASYKKSQAKRMREAGFSDKDVVKFEQSMSRDPVDGDISQLRWSRKGQSREWDVDKQASSD